MKKVKAPYNKNEIVTVTVTDMGSGGEGIGRTQQGYTLFIKDAVIGDTVTARIMKANKSYGFARLEEVLVPSAGRAEPLCPLYRKCGGCQIQAMSYAFQLDYKYRKVREDLIRIGGFPEASVDACMRPAVGMEDPWRYRNKEQVPVGTDKEGKFVTGFYAGRTHSIVPMRDCLLGREENARILETVLSYMEQYRVPAYEESSGSGMIRHILIRNGIYTNQVMVCIVAAADRLPREDALVSALRELPGMASISLNTNKEKTNVILGRKVRTLWGSDVIEDDLFIRQVRYEKPSPGSADRETAVFTDTEEKVRFRISPLSFYQVNPRQTEKLYSLVLHLAELTGKEVVWDLYCGVGTISLFLAGRAGQVYGVEIIPAAIEDARRNAALNHIDNARFYVGKAEEVLPDYVKEQEERGQLGKVDLIVVDPPRKGCDPVCLDTILKIRPEKVIYVSCDPATLARDLKILCEGGYGLRTVQPVDQFPQTSHVECVVLMSRKDT